jgi:hypothetical protein
VFALINVIHVISVIEMMYRICLYLLNKLNSLFQYLRYSRPKVTNYLVDRPALGPTQPPIQWVPEALSLEVKCPGHEAEDLPPSSAEVKECVDL